MKATSVFKDKNISKKISKKSVIKHSIKQAEQAPNAEQAEQSKHMGSKTIKIKDISAITPIPTAIKIKEPEPIQTVKECSQFHYPLNDILNTNFDELKSKLFSKLLICPYFITTCQNRSDIMKPYLQYLLYKYPPSNSKISNLMVFPFKDLNKKVDIEKQANVLLDEVIKVKIKRYSKTNELKCYCREHGKKFLIHSFHTLCNNILICLFYCAFYVLLLSIPTFLLPSKFSSSLFFLKRKV